MKTFNTKRSFDSYVGALFLIAAVVVGHTHYLLASKMTYTPNYPSAVSSALLFALAVGFAISGLRSPGSVGKVVAVLSLVAAVYVAVIAHERYGSYWFRQRIRKVLSIQSSEPRARDRKSVV